MEFKSRIMDAFDDFYSSLSNLVGNPNNLTIRTEASTRAQTMAEYIQNMGESMRQLQDEANTEIKIDVGTLIEYVTSGSAADDPVVIHIDPTTHQVTATLAAGAITKEMLSAEVKTIVETAGTDTHTHANKTVLDGITAAKVAAWDSAETNAKNYAKNYADTLTAWGSF